jgi:hypothetical protein
MAAVFQAHIGVALPYQREHAAPPPQPLWRARAGTENRAEKEFSGAEMVGARPEAIAPVNVRETV